MFIKNETVMKLIASVNVVDLDQQATVKVSVHNRTANTKREHPEWLLQGAAVHSNSVATCTKKFSFFDSIHVLHRILMTCLH